MDATLPTKSTITHFHFRRQWRGTGLTSSTRLLAWSARTHLRATAALLTALDKPCRQMTITKRTGLLAICMRQLALGAAALALLAASTAAGAQSYTFSFLDGLGGSYSVANGINNAGQVVGFSYTTGNSTHATLWNGITPTALGGTDSVAFAINNAGQVVGYSGNHATIWNGTTPTALDGLSGGFSIAAAINNDGQVVGESQTTPGGAVHAILWNGTTPIDLNKYLDSNLANAGWFLSSANGINDIGSIVGQARTRPDGESRAYILSVTAVPEPQTYALMLAGLGMVCFATLRRKPANA